MNKLMSAIVGLCVLSLMTGLCINKGFAAESVLGKATITKGTTLEGFSLIDDTNGMPFTFVANKDQELYITSKIEPKEGTHNGGYILSADNFSHACPVHGEEIIELGKIAIPTSLVEDGTIVIILYGELGTIKKDN